jgi:hypothetical protein
MVTELSDEIPNHVYQTISNKRKRNKSLRKALFNKGLKEWKQLRLTYQLCAELAFKKAQVRRFPEEQDLLVEINRLRRELFEIIELGQVE